MVQDIMLKSPNISGQVVPGNLIVGVVTSAVYVILFDLASVCAHQYANYLATAGLFLNQNMQLLIIFGILMFSVLVFHSSETGSSKQKYLGFKVLS